MVQGGAKCQKRRCDYVHPRIHRYAPEEGPQCGHNNAQGYQLLRPEPVREQSRRDREEELTEGWDGHDDAYLLVGEAKLILEDRKKRGAHVPSRVNQCVNEDHDEKAEADKPVPFLRNILFYFRSHRRNFDEGHLAFYIFLDFSARVR